MTPHLRRSRVTKALTDAGIAGSFPEAEARLDAVHPCVVLGEVAVRTAAGQAAALTAVATAYKCFGRVTLVAAADAPLIAAFPLGRTLRAAGRALGARLAEAVPRRATHLIGVGAPPLDPDRWQAHCWWDRWRAGVSAEAPGPCGDPRLGLSGVFAGALAVRQVFAWVLRGAAFRPRDAAVSLWAPWDASAADRGPTRFTAPDALWLVGLGHLGQAYIWNLLTLPYSAPRRAALQDDQRLSEENEPTSLLVTRLTPGERKVRLANRWLEAAGWETQLIERRHRGDIRLATDDPPFLLAGLDDVVPRRILAAAGFDYMVDGGIGHGAADFEGLQVRVIPKAAAIDGLWNDPAAGPRRDRLLARPAYRELERAGGACGAYDLAGASVAVPFVGAATGALAIAQLVRLASGQPGGALIQLGLAAPEMIIDGGRAASPAGFLGGEHMDLDTAATPCG